MVERAREDGVAGLLWEGLCDSESGAPDDAMEVLHGEAGHVRAVNEDRLERLGRVLDGLRSMGVPVMTLKGAALARELYGDVGLRPMCDVDLLIRGCDAGRMDRAMDRLGYERGRVFLTRDFYPKYHYEADYGARDGLGPRLDVHVRPWRPLRCAGTVPAAAMWEDCRETRIGGTTALAPGREDMLLHLACHTAFHGAGRLLWLAEMDRYVWRFGGELDWDKLVGRALRWSVGYAAWLALDRVERLFGGVAPAEVLGKLRRSGRWRDRLTVWQAPRDRRHPVARTMVDMVVTPGLGFRLGYLKAVLLPEDGHLRPAGAREPGGGRSGALARRALGVLR
jgi:hypothetical protein